MASAMMQPTSTQRRSKEVTYGKSSRKPAATFDGDTPSPSKETSAARMSGIGQLRQMPKKSVDPADAAIFDVPSSDDETPKKLVKNSLPRSKPAGLKQLPNHSSRSTQRVKPPERKASPAKSSLSDLSSRKRKRFVDNLKTSHDTESESNEDHTSMPIERQAYHTPSPHSSCSTNNWTSNIPSKESKEAQFDATTATDTPRRAMKRRFPEPEEPKATLSRLSTPTMSSPTSADLVMTTPPRQTNLRGTPRSTIKGNLTPRQAQMWRNLLGDDLDTSPSENKSHLDLEALNLCTDHKSKAYTDQRHLLPRRKLVDSLSQPPSHYASESDFSDINHNDEEEPVSPVKRDQISNLESQDLLDHTEYSAFSASQQAYVAEIGPTVTYASQRSFLKEPTPDFETSLQQSLFADLDSTIDKSSRKGVRIELENDQEGGGMRSIHDLRASGDNARFDDQMNILLQDLDIGSTISTKRSAVMDLAMNLSDQSYLTRFIEGGYESQVFGLLQSEDDLILGAAASWAIFNLLDSKFHNRIAFNIYDTGILKTLGKLLSESRDITRIARDRTSNMSRIAQESVVDLLTHIRNSNSWQYDTETTMSPELLALTCIDLLVRRMREFGHFESILDKKTISTLVFNFPSDQSTANIRMWNLTLSILETSTVGPKAPISHLSWTADELAQLVKICESGICDSEDTTTSLQTLRLLINLTNNQELNCNAFASPRLIGRLLNLILNCFDTLSKPAEEAVRLVLLDQLVLTLGVMINVAEWSDRARESTITPSATTLDALVKVFVSGRDLASSADSLAESQSNVGHGYLAVLLGNLSLNGQVRTQIVSNLPGRRLSIVTEALEEFSLIHKKVDLEEAENKAGESTWAALSQRLQVVADTLKACDSI